LHTCIEERNPCPAACARRPENTDAFSGSARPVRESCLGCCVIGSRSHTVFGLGSRDSAGWLSSRRPRHRTIKTAPRSSNPGGALPGLGVHPIPHMLKFAEHRALIETIINAQPIIP